MASPAQPAPTDPADLLDDTADNFVAAADSIDDFITNAVPPLSTCDADALGGQSARLRTQAQHFNALGMAATLASIQADLNKIKATTAKAAEQLAVMTNFNKIVAIATAVLNLGTSIAVAPTAAGILTAAQALETSLLSNAE